jgi:hypothetical protein
MRRIRLPLAALAIITVQGLAAAQTPAERGAARVERELARDRLREAEPTGRPAEASPATDRVQQLDQERATNQPGVGRPETLGRLPDEQRATGADRNVNR